MYRRVRGSRSISIDKLGPTVKIWARYPYQLQRNHGHAQNGRQVKICTVAKATEMVVGLIVIRADESLFYQPSTTPLVSPLPFPIMPLICSGPTSSMTHFSLSNCVYSPNEPFSTSHNEFFFPFLHRQNISEHKTLGCVKWIYPSASFGFRNIILSLQTIASWMQNKHINLRKYLAWQSQKLELADMPQGNAETAPKQSALASSSEVWTYINTIDLGAYPSLYQQWCSWTTKLLNVDQNGSKQFAYC